MQTCPDCHADVEEGARSCPRCTGLPVGSRRADPYIGRFIKMPFRIDEALQAGGMGQVYLGTQTNLGRRVAIKVLLPALTRDTSALARFAREAHALSALRHENVVEIIDLGEADDGAQFIVMEYVPGKSLHQLARDEAPLGEERIVRIAAQVLSALEAAHAHRIVHRDLKPQNIMVEPRSGLRDFVKVLDFGIAKMMEPGAEEPGLTRAGIIGTAEYMSPEQGAGVAVDGRSDLYSLGVVLYELLAGRLPFVGRTWTEVIHKHAVEPPLALSAQGAVVSPALEAAVMRALVKAPGDRFQSAAEMRGALAACVSGPGVTDAAPAGTQAYVPHRAPARASAGRSPTPSPAPDAPGLPAPAPPRLHPLRMVLIVSAILMSTGGVGLVRAVREGRPSSPADGAMAQDQPGLAQPGMAPAGAGAAGPGTRLTEDAGAPVASPGTRAGDSDAPPGTGADAGLGVAPTMPEAIVLRPRGILQSTPDLGSLTPSVARGTSVLRVTANLDGVVYVDGKRLGPTPREVLVWASSYDVRVVIKPGCDRGKRVLARPGGVAVSELRFDPVRCSP